MIRGILVIIVALFVMKPAGTTLLLLLIIDVTTIEMPLMMRLT